MRSQDMSIRGRAVSRIVVWFAIAAVTVVGMALVQRTSPSLIDQPLERHDLFDAELLSDTKPSSLTLAYTIQFNGQLTSVAECQIGRQVFIYEDDGDASSMDPFIATGTTMGGGLYTANYNSPDGLQTYYAKVMPVPYTDVLDETHTCGPATSPSIQG